LFKGFSKLLICGGYSAINTCEVISLESSAITCKNPPDFPATVYRAIGGLGIQETPIVCGGRQDNSNSNSCYSLEDNEWVSYDSMSSVRVDFAVARLQDGTLLVTGGNDKSGSSSNTSETLTEVGWESNTPPLPVTLSGHCMVTVNSTNVMVIGGHQNDKISGKTLYFTVGEEDWTEGPELKNKRTFHSCGKIRRDKEGQELSIIVAGGQDGSSYLSSVEILNEGDNEWQTGPELPFGINWSQMVEDQNGGVVLIGGFSESIGILDTLYQLPHGDQDAVWTIMEQKLETSRHQSTAILVPDNVVDCS
jgi:N-acetylneuraminic acid mutarotase